MRHYSSVAQAMQLQAPVDASATSLTVDGTVGLPVSTPFTVVVDVGTASEEIVTVTAVAGPSLTVVRGQDGTAAQSHSGGAVVRHMVTARDLREAQQHIDAEENVHGVIGSLEARLAALEEAATYVVPTGGVVAFAASPSSGWLECNGAAVSRETYATLFAAIGTTYGAGDGSTTFAVPNLKGRTIVGVDSSDSDWNANGKVFGAKDVTLTVSHIPSHNHTVVLDSVAGHTHSGTTSSNGSHSHSATVTAARANHQHNSGTIHALISPTAAGNLYFVTTNQGSEFAYDRIDASYNGSNAARTNFVATRGQTTTEIGGSGPSASISSAGSHTHTYTTSSAGGHTHSTTVSSYGLGGAHNNVQPSMALTYFIKT